MKIDLFGRAARIELQRHQDALLRQETALEKAALELRLMRAAFKAGAAGEKLPKLDREAAFDEQYLRVLAYLLIAEENIKIALNKGTFYNLRPLYPPAHADDDSVDDFIVSLRRHLFG